MKNILKLTLFSLLAIGLLACGGNTKKLTQEDLKKAEASLFNEDRSIKVEEAPKVAEKYCQFVEQNPDDSTAATWLFHAMEINVMLKNADKSIELCNQLTEQYPDSEWAPRALLYVGSFVYDDILNDTAQAHAMYQKLIDDYPNDRLVEDAKKSIEYLGLTSEQIMARIMMSNLEEIDIDDIVAQ